MFLRRHCGVVICKDGSPALQVTLRIGGGCVCGRGQSPGSTEEWSVRGKVGYLEGGAGGGGGGADGKQRGHALKVREDPAELLKRGLFY